MLASIFRVTRFWNLAIVAAAQWITVVFLLKQPGWSDWRLWLVTFSTVAIAAGGYIINDYYDIKIDLINKPDRVVVGKTMSRRWAIILHSVLSLAGCFVGFWIAWPIGVINFICAFMLWLYSNDLKRRPFIGNLVVALLTGTSVLLVNELYLPREVTVQVYALFAALMTLVREIIKDMEDLRGDATFGCRTLPVIWGVRRSKILVYALLLMFPVIVLSLHYWVRALPIYFFLFCLFAPLAVLFVWLIRADTTEDFHRLSTVCKIIMVAGMISMVYI